MPVTPLRVCPPQLHRIFNLPRQAKSTTLGLNVQDTLAVAAFSLSPPPPSLLSRQFRTPKGDIYLFACPALPLFIFECRISTLAVRQPLSDPAANSCSNTLGQRGPGERFLPSETKVLPLMLLY